MGGRNALARSAHGLDRDDSGWWRRAACAGKDPDWWTYGGALSAANRDALRLCREVCPVRRQCRDEAHGGPKPRSQIIGGWIWDANGRSTPAPADTSTPVIERSFGGPKPVIDRRTVFAAARAAVRREERRAAIQQRLGVSKTVLSAAVQVVRWVPHLEQRVIDGKVSLDAAIRQARAAKAGRT